MNGERVPSRPRPLLERNQELAVVDARVAAATAEQGSFLVLEGRAGLGKSALLAEVRRRAVAGGLNTCSAVGSELERAFAFGVVRQLFEPAIRSLSKEDRARVLEGAAALAEPLLDLGGSQVGRDQFASLHGLYWLVTNLAARTPLLLAVDDAHWADVASLRWLAYLLNRLEGLPLLVAIATRPSPRGPEGEVLTTILAHARVRILPVGPLGEGSVATLVRNTLGVEPDPIFTSACLRVTAGNALGLNELLREQQAKGVRPTGAAAADLEMRAPDAIARRVQRDLSLLGPEAERLASAIAVLGDGTELRLIARLADLDSIGAAKAADDLFGADVLASGRPPHFAHPLLRAAVYDQLVEGARQMMHRQAAEILHAERADPEVVAAHLLRCDAGGGAGTIDWLRAAAPLALRRGAPEVAASYLLRALRENADMAHRIDLLAEVGRAELAAADLAAIGHLREAMTHATDHEVRAAILGDLALAAAVLESDEAACLDLLNEALEELRGSDVDASTTLECFVAGMAANDRRSASSVDSHYPRLRELARSATPNAELARVALANLVSWRDGNREEAVSLLKADFDLTVLLQGRYLDLIPLIWSMMALLGVDDLCRADAWCEIVTRKAATEGHATVVATSMVFKTCAESRMGLLAEAEADATAALELSRQYFPYWTPVVSTYLAEILMERGRRQAAYDLIEEVSLGPGVTGGMVEATIREVRGRLRLARGWRHRGVDDLRGSGKACEVLRLGNPIIWPWRASLATALAQDHAEEARQIAEENLANARRSGIPRAIGVALRTLAGLNQNESIDLLTTAVTTLEKSPAPLDLARAMVDLGATLRRRGFRVEARRPLREALEIAARCGAVTLMEEAQAEALAAGARPRRARLRGVDALTPSELRVARLAAEGRSNREIAQALFITVNTVADHLGGSYSKLGITSRDRLAPALELSSS